MDCEEVKEALDAYALGALSPVEAKAIEAHVATCSECRGLLDEAVRVANQLPLGVPLWNPSPQLRQRILAAAQRSVEPRERSFGRRAAAALLPLAAALLLAAAVGSFAWSLSLQGRIGDLENDLDSMRRQVQSMESRQSEISNSLLGLGQEINWYGQMVSEQRSIFAPLTAPDVHTVQLSGREPAANANAVYFYSVQNGTGGLTCTNLPPLPEGKAYHLWFFREGKAYSGGAFRAWNGVGLHAVNLAEVGIKGPVSAYGVSIEDAGAKPQWPTSELVLYAENAR